jgi:DNA processing protein
MISSISSNTQAILLLTAPLLAGQKDYSSELLSLGEYNQIARILLDNQREPADLLGPEASDILDKLHKTLDKVRLTRLLARGFLLSQAVEHWQARSIWVISRADTEYPKKLKSRLKDSSPRLLYGCGDISILETGGLAIVGSRNIDETLVQYTWNVGRLSSEAHLTVISGGARGIDQAAMRGALETNGRVAGVLTNNLERLVLAREHREYFIDNKLVLVSPYDPAAGFDVGHAMQRNKLIYALADAALIVSSDYQSGGTWAGAIEQIEKLHFVPIFVRSTGDISKGLKALQKMGALPWSNTSNPEELAQVLKTQPLSPNTLQEQVALDFDSHNEIQKQPDKNISNISSQIPYQNQEEKNTSSADCLFAKVKELILDMKMPTTLDKVASELQVSKMQANTWLQRLVEENILQKKQKPLQFILVEQKKLL